MLPNTCIPPRDRPATRKAAARVRVVETGALETSTMPMRPPNVLLVLTDDQGYPPIGANGHPFVQTRHLDRFRAEAVRFEQFHAGTTCAPTRAALGLSAARIKIRSHSIGLPKKVLRIERA